MSWISDWVKEQDMRFFRAYYKHIEAKLWCWFNYDDPMYNSDWQMLADFFINGNITNLKESKNENG